MKLDTAYLMLLFLKPQEMKTNFILMTEKALKIRTDSKNKSNDSVLTTSTALGWFRQESLAHIFHDLFCSISCFPQTCHNVQLVSSELNILHPERRFYTLSWKQLQKAAMRTLSIQVLIVFFRVYLDAEVMSLRGFWHQQKGETTNITSPNSSRSLCFSCLCLCVDALSTNVSSHRAFLETKVAQLPLRQRQVYELASGRQRIVGGDLDSNPA